MRKGVWERVTRAKGSVGEGEAGKKAEATHHAGGQCVSEKYDIAEPVA